MTVNTPHDTDASEAALVDSAVLKAAALQDHLLSAHHDLERLERLINDACDSLLQGFQGAATQIETAMSKPDRKSRDDGDLQASVQALYSTVTALQFHDMATQLIQHTSQRLRSCADQLAQDALGADGDEGIVVERAPMRPNPVTQDEMDAGSVELF